jgi:hypothetical protein
MSNEQRQFLSVGTFVEVGGDLGVIVGLSGSDNVPEEHYAVWYGQTAGETSTPLCRTVPIDYCKPVTSVKCYH